MKSETTWVKLPGTDLYMVLLEEAGDHQKGSQKTDRGSHSCVSATRTLTYLLDPNDADVGPGASLAQAATVGCINRLGEILQGLDEDIKRIRARK